MDEDVIHVYTMEYYSVIKRNKIGSFEETWVDLESVTQSEVSHKEKNMYCILTLDGMLLGSYVEDDG